jgi:5-deoxy-glucuronate isomerase
MYIQKEPLHAGYNEYICLNSPQGRLAMMDVGLLILEPGESYILQEPEKEYALMLIEGKAVYQWDDQNTTAQRSNPYDNNPWCMHAPRCFKTVITAIEHSEFYIQKTINENDFSAKLYTPEDVHTQRAGCSGELNGTMRRDIRTIFDYSNAPFSNMVLGEVVNFPGLWSSYPPHWHPQPEVYFYRFDKPQGFGAGFTNGNVYEIHHNGLLLITDKFHSQVTAPGYTMCYMWGIRHLPGDPWKKTRIDDEEHTWMLQKDAIIRCAE